MDIVSQVRPPHAGEQERFICADCHQRFGAKLPELASLAFVLKIYPPQCPKCGSHAVMRDPCIVH
jgi:transposase-like protein